jgi:Protein of unknown function (DUF2934)
MKTSRIPKDTPEHDLEQQKQLIAYQLWEEEGRPDGKAEAHWTQACLVVMSLSESEAANAPVWLKRQDEPAPQDAKLAQPGLVEKRSATRQAA